MLLEKNPRGNGFLLDTFDWDCSFPGVTSVGTFWKSLSGPLKEILYDFKKQMQENMTRIIAFLTKETREEE